MWPREVAQGCETWLLNSGFQDDTGRVTVQRTGPSGARAPGGLSKSNECELEDSGQSQERRRRGRDKLEAGAPRPAPVTGGRPGGWTRFVASLLPPGLEAL